MLCSHLSAFLSQVCGKCLEGWVLANAGLCQNCETSGGMDKNTVKALVITAVVLASMALWYLFALRPLINPFLGNNRRFLNKIKACYKKIANFKNEATEKKDEATAKKQKALLTFSAIAKLQGIFKVVCAPGTLLAGQCVFKPHGRPDACSNLT